MPSFPFRVACALAWSCMACRTSTMTPEDYLQNEFALVRKGVDVQAEEREVRRVLEQRGLQVVSEVRGAGFVALGARSLDGRLSALRVITMRGVTLAEDADTTDLFVPSTLELLDDFAPSTGDYVLVASARMRTGTDRGCVTLTRILPDGSVVPGTFDLSPLGPRACVSSVAHGERGRLRATVAWPAFTLIETPEIAVELAFAITLVGQEPARVPLIKLAAAGPWLEQERARLAHLDTRGAPFSERHAVGVARAAVALLAGQDVAHQLSAYRMAIDLVPPGSLEADMVVETSEHIENGWLDALPAEASPDATPPEDAEVIEPEPMPVEPAEEAETPAPQ